MRRVLSLLAIAAMLLALTAGPALAQAPPPGGTEEDTPGDPQCPGCPEPEEPDPTPDPETNPATSTPDAGSNCYGQLNSNNLKGPAGNPGSPAEPTEFPPGTPNYTGHAVSNLDDDFGEDPGGDPGDEISGIQQSTRDALAGESEVTDPETGEVICV